MTLIFNQFINDSDEIRREGVAKKLSFCIYSDRMCKVEVGPIREECKKKGGGVGQGAIRVGAKKNYIVG